MKELLFIVKESQDGGFFASAVGVSIVTQGESIDEIRNMIIDAVKCHFDEKDLPRLVHMHVTREETFAL